MKPVLLFLSHREFRKNILLATPRALMERQLLVELLSHPLLLPVDGAHCPLALGAGVAWLVA